MDPGEPSRRRPAGGVDAVASIGRLSQTACASISVVGPSCRRFIRQMNSTVGNSITYEMHWVLIPFALVVVIIVGVRVIRDKGRTPSVTTDRNRIEEWKRAEGMGPILHGLRSSAPFALGYCLVGPAAKFWWQTGRPGYPLEDLGLYLLFALAFAVVGEFFAWKILQSGAREAAARLHDDGDGRRPLAGLRPAPDAEQDC